MHMVLESTITQSSLQKKALKASITAADFIHVGEIRLIPNEYIRSECTIAHVRFINL